MCHRDLEKKTPLKADCQSTPVSGDDVCREYLVLTQTFRSRCQRFGRLFSNLAIAGSTFWHDAAVDIRCMCAGVSIVSSENSV